MHRCRRGAAASVLLLGILVGCGRATGVPAAGSRVPFSPYVDVTLAPAASLPGAVAQAHERGLTLAFVVAGHRGCRATWGGQSTATVPPAAVARLRAEGTAVAVSFGGQAGSELATRCRGVAALTAQYRSILTAYRPARVDFDIEGAAVADGAANLRRWRALRPLLAGAGAPGLSLTLPADPGGLGAGGLRLVRGALAGGLHLEAVNLLAMDYGSGFPTGAVSMAGYAERTATAAARQLGRLFGSTAAAWRHIGLTVMIGRNDTPGETFTLDDARTVAAFAATRRLHSLSMWSLSRDRPCPAGTPDTAQAICSGIATAPYAFSRLLGG